MKRKIIIAAGFTVIALAASALCSADPPRPEIVMKNSGTVYEAVATGYFTADADRVWSLLTDHERAPDYLKSIRQSRIVKRGGNTVILDQIISSPVKNFEMRIEMKEYADSFTLRWQQIKGPFLSNSGSWVLLKSGNKMTKGIYSIRIENDSILPGWVIKTMLKSSIPDMFAAIGRQVE
jgi:ribosome-associated toxin RatA of RatAB toxin-antitoxin module